MPGHRRRPAPGPELLPPAGPDGAAVSPRLPEWMRLYRQPAVLTMLFLGFSAGLPFLLVFSTLTARLRDGGVAVATIGFFSWVGITYSVKFAWAPVVDRLRLPGFSRLGKRRGWMLLAQAGIAAGLCGLGVADPTQALGTVAACAVLVAFAAATQDIVVDAYRIESAPEHQQAAMAATYIIGYRGGLLAGGAGALYIAQYGSWTTAYLVMAALMGVGMATVMLRPEPSPPDAGQTREQEQRVARYLAGGAGGDGWHRRLGAWFVGAVVCPFVDFFQRHGRIAVALLALVALYRVSDLAMAAMANPLYIDLGFTLADIANITKVFGVFMTILGGVLGGILVARFGIPPLLVAGAVAVAATNLLFVALAETGPSRAMLVLTISGDNLANGLASAVFIAFLSSLTSRAYTATQYALLSSLMTLPGKFLGGFSGLVVESQGYAGFFWLAAALGLPAIALAWYVARTPRPGEPSPAGDR